MQDSSTIKEPWQSRFISHAALLLRPMTLGVRAMVLDDENRVLLVRHTYVAGYFFPGGGVDGGETLEQAMLRELREEANVVAEPPYALHGVYLNRKASKRDHVALYVVRAFRHLAPHAPDREIAEAGFFPLDALPEATTRATRARLAEVLEGVAGAAYW